MAGAQATGEGPLCVGCGGRVKTLFVQYSPGNILLMKSDKYKVVADPYIECEFMGIVEITKTTYRCIYKELCVYCSFGGIGPSVNRKLSAPEVLETKLSDSKSRFYIKFDDVQGHNFGFNGSTF